MLLEAAGDLSPLLESSDVVHFEQPDDSNSELWELRLRDGAEPQGLLNAAIERGIPLRRFDGNDPTLHDVFVHLVGPEAREAQAR